MIKSRKKGFTLVELVIVVAVVAILVAILIPTFGSLIRKANMSSDQVATRDMNTLLSFEKVEKDKLNIEDIKTILKDAGYRTDDLSPLTKGFAFYWIEDLQIIVLYDLDKDVVVFPTNLDLKYPENGEGWLLLSEIVADEKVFPGEYVLLNGSGVSISFTENNEIQVYKDDEEAFVIPSENIVMNENGFSIIDTDKYDGDFMICDDGYIECDGVPVAKKEELWVNLPSQENSAYLIIRDGVVYISEDGNSIDEQFLNLDNVREDFDSMEIDADEFYNNYGYYIDELGDQVKVTNIFDLMTLEKVLDEDSVWYFIGTGKYKYYGGSAMNRETDNSLIVEANWLSSNVSYVSETKLFRVDENGTQQMSINDVIADGVYAVSVTEQYYYKNSPTDCIFYADDYPFAYEPGMTYREWINSEYSSCTALNDYDGDYSLYIPKEDLDKVVGTGSASGIQNCHISGLHDEYGTFSFTYCDGIIENVQIDNQEECTLNDSPDFEYAGLWYGFGENVDKSFASYDVFNYYIENNLPNSSMIMCAAYKQVNTINIVDISDCLTKEGGRILVHLDMLKEKNGINGTINFNRIVKDGEYTVYFANGGYHHGDNIQFDDFRSNYEVFKGHNVGVSFYFNGVYYEGFIE